MGTLEQLRYRAASTGTGTLVVTIEQLNAIHADAQATIAALQARVEAHERAYQEGHPTPCTLGSYCPYCEIERRVAQLTQRTAELEAANKLLYRKNCELGRFETIISDLQTELERVRGELAETKEEVKCLDEQVSALNQGCLEYERLIAALPKMEGEIRVIEVATDEWHVYDTIFATKAGADNYAALLQHRQGMEG